MTDREALFRAILENPDDDTLRLIYADALDEESDARRAAFVRAQVQFAKLPEYDPARVRARHHDPDRHLVAEWVGALPDLPAGLRWDREPFRRGFPGAIQADDAAAFVRGADEVFARFPVESLELSVVRLAEAREFAQCLWLSRLARLAVEEGLSGPSATRLLNSPHYERLRELHVGAGLTTPATAAAVVRSHVFRQLTALSCRTDRPGGGGRALVDGLARLTNPPRLESLDLSGNRLTAELVARLLAAPAASTVADLDLSDNNLGAAGVRAIAAADLPHLRSLHLLRTRPEEDGVRALAEAGFLAGLRGLTLGGNILPPSAARVLARAPDAPGLRLLDLRDNRLGDSGAAALADSPRLQNLVYLDLAENGIEDRGADALAESPHLDGLIYLDLYGNPVSPAAADRLVRRFGARVFL
jgi:uncharacterized protein (TIGR02996 family)